MSSIKEDIRVWSTNNNGHPLDDERLYAIVLKTMQQRCCYTNFEDVIGDKNEAEVAFKRYEDLHNFAKYLERNGYLDLAMKNHSPQPSELFHETSH